MLNVKVEEGDFVGKSGNGWEFVGGGGKNFMHRIELCPLFYTQTLWLYNLT